MQVVFSEMAAIEDFFILMFSAGSEFSIKVLKSSVRADQKSRSITSIPTFFLEARPLRGCRRATARKIP